MHAARSDTNARRLFLASLLYLSLLLPLMLIDRGVFEGRMLESAANAGTALHSFATGERGGEAIELEANP
jgi:hypothetical protein